MWHASNRGLRNGAGTTLRTKNLALPLAASTSTSNNEWSLNASTRRCMRNEARKKSTSNGPCVSGCLLQARGDAGIDIGQRVSPGLKAQTDISEPDACSTASLRLSPSSLCKRGCSSSQAPRQMPSGWLRHPTGRCTCCAHGPAGCAPHPPTRPHASSAPESIRATARADRRRGGHRPRARPPSAAVPGPGSRGKCHAQLANPALSRPHRATA